ncbi:hypothetical protein ACHAWF_016689 [Thalassiosira exigua]
MSGPRSRFPRQGFIQETRHHHRCFCGRLHHGSPVLVPPIQRSDDGKGNRGRGRGIFFLPSLMSLAFAICTVVEEVPKYVATAETTNKIGSALFTVGCGLISYFSYPDVQAIFYLLGAGGIVAALFVMWIPTSAIDNDRARQLRSKAVGEEQNNTAEAMSYRIILTDKKILVFTVCTFLYHFANAVVVPLVTQYIGITDKRMSLTWTSIALFLSFLVQAMTNQAIRILIENVPLKTLFIAANIVLLLRCIAIVLLIEMWANTYALVATQALDGIGAGIYDTLIPIVVGQMTQDSGRFGFVYGVNLFAWRIGHTFSFLLGESLAHGVSYTAAFLTQAGIGLVSLLVLFTTFSVNPLEKGRLRIFNPCFDEEAVRSAFRQRVLASLNEMGRELTIGGLYEVFKSIDGNDGNGTLDRDELKLFIEQTMATATEETPIDPNILFDDIDEDKNGAIDFVEFILYLEDIHEGFSPQIKLIQEKVNIAVGQALGKVSEQLTVNDLKKAFKDIDVDGSESLDKKELRGFFKEIDVGTSSFMSDVELDVLYRFMDTDLKGGIDFSEFVTFLNM